MASRGNASRRRPSMDWPLSREEKKCCALQLYAKDVETCNELLDDKDRALQAAKEEIKALRRASTASTRTSIASTRSPEGRTSIASTRSPDDFDVDANDGLGEAAEKQASPPCSASKLSATATRRTPGKDRAASPHQHPTMQRSSSLEAVSSLFAPSRRSKGQDPESSPQRGMRRSNSLETYGAGASSFWGGAWKAVRKGAKVATDSAKETARILAEETKLIVDEARSVFEEQGNHDVSAAADAPKTGTVPKEKSTEYIEWRLDLEPNAGSPGLLLEPAIQGEPRRVSGVTPGLPVGVWNDGAMPVTVYLHPGRREAVMRRIAVRPGDELIAVDGEPMLAALEDEKVGECHSLSFRRKRLQRAAPSDSA